MRVPTHTHTYVQTYMTDNFKSSKFRPVIKGPLSVDKGHSYFYADICFLFFLLAASFPRHYVMI